MPLRQVQIERRVFELDVAEQELNRAQVGTGLQEVGGVRMPQCILTLPMNQAPPQPPFTTVTIRFTANP